jgi:hypothetical protein
MRAVAPNGEEIVGTLETLQARANIEKNSFKIGADGCIDFEWEGSTDVYWDTQETVTRDGKRIFLGVSGRDWNEDEVRLEE